MASAAGPGRPHENAATTFVSIPRDQQRAVLLQLARQAMIENGLDPDFPPAAVDEAKRTPEVGNENGGDVRDLRELPWCSIDNDDSRDLDQLTVAEALADDCIRMWVAIADVSAAVGRGSALDDHAGTNTTSVYTPPRNFPMLPERLSTDLTSLLPGQDRLVMIVEMNLDRDGRIGSSELHRALVRNQAKLAYSGVGP
jgi:exoribonuclease R